MPHYSAAFRGKPLSRACRMRQIAFCRQGYHIAKCAADAKSVTNLAKYIINETEMQESVREAANCIESLGCLRVILGCLCDRKLYVPVFISESSCRVRRLQDVPKENMYGLGGILLSISVRAVRDSFRREICTHGLPRGNHIL